jgi:hypothetical protein
MTPTTPRVAPFLRLAILCQEVEEDGSGRPANLAFPVHTLRFPSGVQRNYRPPVLSLYVQLQGGRGTHFIRVVMRVAGGLREVAAAPPVEEVFDGADDVFPLELAIELHRLVFPEPDVYELLVYVNHRNLHEPSDNILLPFPPIRVVVLPADGSPGGTE